MKKQIYFNLWLFSIFAFLGAVYMPIRTGRAEYAWIIGSLLLGIGADGGYAKERKK